jgi:hypothetical protein
MSKELTVQDYLDDIKKGKTLKDTQFRVTILEVLNKDDIVDVVVDKFANTLRRMGINIIVEKDPVTDLSLGFTVSLPDEEPYNE